MVEQTETVASGVEESEAPVEKTRRDRSTIEFPYTDLENTVAMVLVLVDKGGGNCDDNQLASWLNQSVGGGSFRARMSAAKLFGLIDNQGRFVTATDLGRRIADAEEGRAARVEAFLKVPLYSALYEGLKGYPLPPPAAIERRAQSLGVAPKQADRARQAFAKSAIYAGFIDQNTNRFIKPSVAPAGGKTAETRDEERSQRDGLGGGRGGGGGSDLHPFIEGLLKTLPPPDTEWAAPDRVKWLQTAASIFGLIYTGDADIKIQINTG